MLGELRNSLLGFRTNQEHQPVGGMLSLVCSLGAEFKQGLFITSVITQA